MDYEEENNLLQEDKEENEKRISPGQKPRKRIVGLSLVEQTRPRVDMAGSLTTPLHTPLHLSPSIFTCTAPTHPTALPLSSTTATTISTSLNLPSSTPHSSTSSYTTSINPSSSTSTTDSSQSSTPFHISPAHLHEELSSCYQSFLYHSSRTPIFETFATDGPFPPISRFTFSSNPHEGLTRACSRQLDDAIAEFRTTICEIHANNHRRLAQMEMNKIDNLVGSAKKIFDPRQVDKILSEAKRHAFNHAQELKHDRKRRNHRERFDRDRRHNRRR